MMVAILLLLATSAQILPAEKPSDTLCHPGERIFFSCYLDSGKTVSICTQPEAAPPALISFRYGTRRKLDVRYIAATNNDRHFYANVLPANPRASIQQVWFDLNGIRYNVTECIGRRCRHSGGIIVSRGNDIVASEACATSHDNVSFDPKVLEFGSDITDSHSFTDLIKLEDAANDFEALYPPEITD